MNQDSNDTNFLEQYNLAIDVPAIIQITQWHSPDSFHFTLHKNILEFNKLNERIGKLCNATDSQLTVPESTSDLSVGQFIFALYSIDRKWYRASVVGVDPELDTAIVSFIDFGNESEIAIKHLRIPASSYRLQDVPRFSIRAKLFNVIPAGQSSWSAEALAYFKFFIENCNVLLRAVPRQVDKDCVAADLFLTVPDHTKFKVHFNDYPASLSECLIFHGHAFPQDFSKSRDDPWRVQRTKVEMAFFGADEGSEHSGRVALANHPGKFFIQLFVQSKMNQMSDLIYRYTERAKGDRGAKIELPRPQMYCLAFFAEDEFWYRAQITAVTSRNDISVTMFDFGNEKKVTLDDLLKIPDNLLLDFPKITIECELAGVRPLTTSAPDWGDQCAMRARELLESGDVKIRIVSFDLNKYTVDVLVNARLSATRSKWANLAKTLAEEHLVLEVHTGAGHSVEPDPAASSSGSGNEDSEQYLPVMATAVVDPWQISVGSLYLFNFQHHVLQLGVLG